MIYIGKIIVDVNFQKKDKLSLKLIISSDNLILSHKVIQWIK